MSWFAAFSSPARGAELPSLRRRVQARLRSEGVARPTVECVGVLVSELTHNAVDASCQASRVHVVLQERDGRLALSVECCGNRDFDRLADGLAGAAALPGPEEERGRGLWLVRNYSRDLRVERGRGGWVRLALSVRPGESA